MIKRTSSVQVKNSELVRDRRELIIRAAIVVFRRHGFHVATTHDIAAEAGLSQSNIYNYVSSKNEVLFMVCEHLVALYCEAVTEACALHTDSYKRLIEALRAIGRIMHTHGEELQLLYHETHALPKQDRKAVLASIARFIQRFQDLLEGYESDYGQIKLQNKRLAANLMTFVPAVIALRAWDFQNADPIMLEGSIFSFILAGLGIPEKAPPKKKTGVVAIRKAG